MREVTKGRVKRSIKNMRGLEFKSMRSGLFPHGNFG